MLVSPVGEGNGRPDAHERGAAPLRGATNPAVAAFVVLIASAVLFASLGAWRARPTPLANTAASPETLAETVIAAMRAGDLDRLRVLALTEDEFRAHVWPALPAARPERNVPFEFVWERLQQNSESHLRHTAAGLGEAPLELRGVRFSGDTTEYGDVIVHRGTQIVVAAADGTDHVIRLFGSMIEQDGAWKVFSYVVD